MVGKYVVKKAVQTLARKFVHLFENLFMLNRILRHVAQQDLSAKEFKENVENKKLTETIKDNYSKRTDEVDHFSKRVMNACGELNTECLYGSLSTVQQFIDLQGKRSNDFPIWYPIDFMQNMLKQNTEAWIQAVHNFDSVYVDGLKNIKNNVRALNKNSSLFLQSLDRIYDLYKFPTVNKKNKK